MSSLLHNWQQFPSHCPFSSLPHNSFPFMLLRGKKIKDQTTFSIKLTSQFYKWVHWLQVLTLNFIYSYITSIMITMQLQFASAMQGYSANEQKASFFNLFTIQFFPFSLCTAALPLLANFYGYHNIPQRQQQTIHRSYDLWRALDERFQEFYCLRT